MAKSTPTNSFWLPVLAYEDSDDITIIIDVDKLVLNKVHKFLTTGKVEISGAQENIDIIEGLELLLPDLELNDQKKLLIEDIEPKDRETDINIDSVVERYEVKENFICNICLTYFSCKQKRDNHVKNIHSTKPRFSCNVCSKILFSKDGLASHMKGHTENCIHECLSCKQTYKNKSDLLKHCMSKGHSHKDNNQGPFKQAQKFDCSECKFTTNRVDSLYRHERNVHGLFNKKLDAISKTLEKKGAVKCPKCDKKFTDSKKAEDHLLQQNCDPLKCEVCGKEFDKRVDLSSHTRDVRSEHKFPCPSCEKVFKQKRNMKAHHNKCKLRETTSNEHNNDNETVKAKRVNRNKRKQLSKTTDNKKDDKPPINNTKPKSINTKKEKKASPILSKGIEDCLKSLENDDNNSDNDDMEDYEEEEG